MRWQLPIREGIVGVVVAVVMLLILFRGFNESPPAADTRPGVPVLVYHYFREGDVPGRIGRSLGSVLLNLPLIPANDYWTVSKSTFESQLRYLRDAGYRTITLEELTAYLRGNAVLPGKSVAITFDDGDESVFRVAYPLMKSYCLVGTVFVITGHMGESWNGLSLSGRQELKEMKNSGVMEIGSHTHDLHYKVEDAGSLNALFADLGKGTSREQAAAVFADFRRSYLEVSQLTGERSIYLAWPFGFGSALADSLARAAGYGGIMTMRAGANRPGDSPYGIKRFTITSRTTMRSFKTILP